MSISIATMGKFWPATGSGSGEVVYVGGGNYGDLKKKIAIHVEKVHYDKYIKKDIKILSVREE